MLWSLVRALLRSPDTLRCYLRMRRGVRGYHAVSQGLIAIGSGDVARRAGNSPTRRRASRPNEPLTLLLGAQTAQLSGDRDAAERTFHAMAGRDDTRLLGLHGLYIEAQRRDDAAAAQLYAEEAAKQRRAPAWAGQAVLEFRCAAGDWAGALERLERNMKSGLVDKATYRRQRAVLLTARALAGEETDRDRAKALALEAVKLAPDAGAGRGARRRACSARRGETAQGRAHHRGGLEGQSASRSRRRLCPSAAGDSARDRLARIESLAEKIARQHRRRAGGGARGARRAGVRHRARARWRRSSIAPTPARGGADGRARGEGARRRGPRARMDGARAACARRDPAWTADGFVSDRWMPVSPVTGRLDAFEWKDPLSGLDGDRADDRGARSTSLRCSAPTRAPRPPPTGPPCSTCPPSPPQAPPLPAGGESQPSGYDPRVDARSRAG